MKRYTVLLMTLLFLTANAFADVRFPDKQTSKEKPGKTINFRLKVSTSVTEPTLIVPKNAAKELRASLDEAIEADGTDSAETTIAASNKIPTLMSGLFLSLAIIFGGVWFARGKNIGKTGKITAGVCVIVFSGLALALTAYANVAPPSYQGLNGSIFSEAMKNHWTGAIGKVKVQIVDRGYETAPIELVVPLEGKDVTKRDEE